MKSRPILFSGAMVRAILDEERPKRQTRRVVKHIPALGDPEDWCPRAYSQEFERIAGNFSKFCPFGGPGTRLWVREAHAFVDDIVDGYHREDSTVVAFRADESILSYVGPGVTVEVNGDHGWDLSGLKWRPSIHMPRWACRLELVVTALRVERVQEISDADAMAEGVNHGNRPGVDVDIDGGVWPGAYRNAFAALWDSINASRGYSWADNPYVWVVEFERVLQEAA